MSKAIAFALCALVLFAAVSVEAQYTTAQAKVLARTILNGCKKGPKDPTCDRYLTLAGNFCKEPKQQVFCYNIVKETCMANFKQCVGLRTAFCSKTGSQAARCNSEALKAIKAIKG